MLDFGDELLDCDLPNLFNRASDNGDAGRHRGQPLRVVDRDHREVTAQGEFAVARHFENGKRQAVAIGRAVSWASKVIILDEPTNHLGARQAGEVLQIIRAAKAKGLGVIFISHTLPHVLEVTDRIIVLRLGRIVKDTPTAEFNVDTLLGTITGTIQTIKVEGD